MPFVQWRGMASKVVGFGTDHRSLPTISLDSISVDKASQCTYEWDGFSPGVHP
jgi:hypothetical protein